jgi:hypothetical protein
LVGQLGERCAALRAGERQDEHARREALLDGYPPAQHLEGEPAAELAVEGEREPELCERVDEVERGGTAQPDGPEPGVRDQTVGDLSRVAFFGGVEEVVPGL